MKTSDIKFIVGSRNLFSKKEKICTDLYVIVVETLKAFPSNFEDIIMLIGAEGDYYYSKFSGIVLLWRDSNDAEQTFSNLIYRSLCPLFKNNEGYPLRSVFISTSTRVPVKLKDTVNSILIGIKDAYSDMGERASDRELTVYIEVEDEVVQPLKESVAKLFTEPELVPA